MKEFLKAMIGKSVEEVIAAAKVEDFEFEYHPQDEEFASIDFEVQGYKAYLVFDEEGIADEWGYYSAE